MWGQDGRSPTCSGSNICSRRSQQWCIHFLLWVESQSESSSTGLYSLLAAPRLSSDARAAAAHGQYFNNRLQRFEKLEHLEGERAARWPPQQTRQLIKEKPKPPPILKLSPSPSTRADGWIQSWSLTSSTHNIKTLCSYLPPTSFSCTSFSLFDF